MLFGVLEANPDCIIHDKKLHPILPLLSCRNRPIPRNTHRKQTKPLVSFPHTTQGSFIQSSPLTLAETSSRICGRVRVRYSRLIDPSLWVRAPEFDRSFQNMSGAIHT